MDDLGTPRGQRLTVSNADEALVGTLRAVIDAGAASGEGNGASLELLDATIELEDLRDRIPLNPEAFFDVTVAVARFVWMISGDDRLADIRFYEEAVTRFSDNQIAVPGSNYGTRLFQPRPGLNQIDACIRRLREDPTTRRAAAVIWAPEDATRVGPDGGRSADIPCAFGLMFHVRAGTLYTQLKMRSNNAYQLLPFNLFEFGLLAEVIAAEVGVQLGLLSNNAASMHVYERARARWEGAAAWDPAASERQPMPAMPPDEALAQAHLLARKEAELRHELHLVVREDLAQLQSRANGLEPWWADLYRLLLSHALVKVGRYRTATAIVEGLDSSLVTAGLSHLENVRSTAIEEGAEQLFVMEGEAPAGIGQAVRGSWGPAEREQALSHLQSMLREIEQGSEVPVLLDEFEALASELVDQRAPVAARSDDIDDPAARFGIDRSEVEERLAALRKRRPSA